VNKQKRKELGFELTFSGWKGGISDMRKALCFTRSLPGRHARASPDLVGLGSARRLCCVSLQASESLRGTAVVTEHGEDARRTRKSFGCL
jgi:hypothetical protein